MTHRDRRTWHAGDDLAARYARGDLPEADAWSLEKHVEGCAACASRLSAAVRTTPAGPVLARVREAVLNLAPTPDTGRAGVAGPATGGWAGVAGSTSGGWAGVAGPAGTGVRAAGPASAGAWASGQEPGPAAVTPAAGTLGPTPAGARASGQELGPVAGALGSSSAGARASGREPDPAAVTPAAGTLGPTPAGAWASGREPDPVAGTLGPTPAGAGAAGRAPVPVAVAASAGAVEPVSAHARTAERGAGTASGPVPRSGPVRVARLLWAAGPAVRGAWLPAVLGVALAALGLSYGAGFPGARALLLALAPVLPVAGVAVSYGPHADPLHEVAAATPGGGLRLALTRTVAVLTVSLPLLTLTGLLLPASGAPAAAAWLLPGLALALASLALASVVGCRAAAALTGGGWLCAVLAPVAVAPGGAATARLAGQLSRCLDGVPAQSGWAAAAVLSAALLTVRRTAYDRPLRP
ncbi:zf-HC2 domain-containing protein [Streptomyces sp. NPDC017252]|uniref:zf-HC2 domain-containing protein n=1 Tax=Streptomyces sp. NPDC017252 TaxID=3364988 RepID=UPI00378AF0EA